MLSFQKLDVYQCSVAFAALAVEVATSIPRDHGALTVKAVAVAVAVNDHDHVNDHVNGTTARAEVPFETRELGWSVWC
jgi:hypothetical protein